MDPVQVLPSVNDMIPLFQEDSSARGNIMWQYSTGFPQVAGSQISCFLMYNATKANNLKNADLAMLRVMLSVMSNTYDHVSKCHCETPAVIILGKTKTY